MTTPEKKNKVTLETFDVEVAFEAAADPSKEGRLARLTYEFETAGVLNRNGRIYPESVFRPACEALNVDAKRGRVYGRNDHPSSYSEAAYSPSIGDAAVLTKSVEMVGNKKVKVVMDVLDNAHGKQLMSCHKAGGSLSISQRAMAIWDAPTESDRTAFGLAKDTNAEIARNLRLICYDVVAQPGFDAADNPIVTEGLEPMWKTADEVKAGNPELYNAIFNAGKASVDVAKLTTEAISAEKPKIVEEAIKPLQTELATVKAQNTKLVGVAESMKASLVSAGIAVETISDKVAAERLAEATKRADEAATALATANANLAKANKDLAELNAKQVSLEVLDEVRKKYVGHKFLPMIEKATEGIADKTKALTAADQKAAEILALVGADGIKGKANETKGAGNTNADANESANENQKNGGLSQTEIENKARVRAASAAILGARA